jgi:hypothetical protein
VSVFTKNFFYDLCSERVVRFSVGLFLAHNIN